MSITHTTLRLGAALAAFGLVLSACGGDETVAPPTPTPTAPDTSPDPTDTPDPGPDPSEPKSIRQVMAVVVPTHPNFVYLTGPAALGFWADQNLEVEIDFANGTAAATQLLVADRTDVIVGGGAVSLYQPAIQGIDTVAFYNVHPGQFSYPVVPVDSPIQSIADLAELEHRARIGTVSLTTGSIQLWNAMAIPEGLQPGVHYEFIAVGVGAGAASALFEQQTIDVLMLWADQYAIIAGVVPEHEFRALPSPGGDLWGVATPAVALKDALEADPDVYARWARGIAMTSVFVRENPAAAAALHTACYPEALPDVDDPDALAEAILAARFNDAMDIAGVPEMEGKWGFFPEKFITAYHNDIARFESPDFAGDPLDLYTNDLIDAINDFDEAAVVAMARNWSDADHQAAAQRCP